MKRVTRLGIATLPWLLIAQPAWAVRTKSHIAAESSQYGKKAVGMIGRGVLNVVTCFVDPLVNTVNETKAGPPLIGTLTGIAKGTGCGVLRLGSGAVDILTYWVPGFNVFPVSDSYDNCLAVTGSAAPPPPEPQLSNEEIGSSSQTHTPAPSESPKKVWKK